MIALEFGLYATDEMIDISHGKISVVERFEALSGTIPALPSKCVQSYQLNWWRRNKEGRPIVNLQVADHPATVGKTRALRCRIRARGLCQAMKREMANDREIHTVARHSERWLALSGETQTM